jgi:DNA replication ATP-dependent helicase Dna2
LKSCQVVGIDLGDISVLSPYRPQLKFLRFENCPVEISTIDKFQGRDQNIIIISLVRSNSDGNIGELLTDWQRLNVAFTRAKMKLLLVGSGRTVLQNVSFRPLLNLLVEKSWIFKLPHDSLSHILNKMIK